MPSCAYCGGEFTGKRSVAKFCSDRCRRDNFQSNTANRVPCVDCGRPTYRTPGQGGSRMGRCRRCQRAQDRLRVEARQARIEKWWAEGMTFRQIANRLGWSLGSVSWEIEEMRAAGRDLPYRYPADRRRHMKEARANAV